MNLSKNQILSILGLGLIIGCFASLLSLPVLIMLGIGLGLLVGGIFREIEACKNKKSNQKFELTENPGDDF